MAYQYHDETIVTELPEDTVFVFGSNLAGIHDSGAARVAALHFAAVKGVGRGWAGQSFAIPTLNEHIQQMPLSQIEHYVDDFKIYAKNHPKMKYFLTALGCGIAGYKVSEIAPLFKGIHSNVIFPESFRPYIEEDAVSQFPDLTAKTVHAFISDDVIFYFDHGYESFEEALDKTDLSAPEKAIALIVLNEELYPRDRYGRGREHEINDILGKLNGKIFNFEKNSEGAMIFVSVIIALMELYDIDEYDFIKLWRGELTIHHPLNRKI
ncbi:A1S_2505 family phage non-structural protein [Acinetobacter beijerinckii]|uniref:A1S_2505 family phage non-structural protein n=1 Tax=Acinetobacter beijerinckii TaxID=262668 RepID=UPI004054F382